jgi:hypothetical protein
MKILYSFDDSPLRNEKHVRYGVRILYTCLCFARASRVHIPTIGTWPFRFPGSSALTRASSSTGEEGAVERRARAAAAAPKSQPNPTQPTICGQRTPQPRGWPWPRGGTREMRSPNASVRRGALRPRQAQKWPRTPARGRARGCRMGSGAVPRWVGLLGTDWQLLLPLPCAPAHAPAARETRSVVVRGAHDGHIVPLFYGRAGRQRRSIEIPLPTE